MDSDVVVRRSQVPLDYVNSAAFWNQRPENVPADQQFFLQYFQAKQKRSGQTQETKPSGDDESRAILDEPAGDDDDDELSTDDEQEKEIWKAMKQSIPQEREDDVDVDDDDDVLEALQDDEDDEEDEEEGGEEGEDGVGEEDDEEDEEEEEDAVKDEGEDEDEDEDEDDEDDDAEDAAVQPESGSDDEPAMFLEDEDDLVPFTNFSEDEEPTAGKKRPAEDTDEAPTSKNRKRTEQRRKRRSAPAFASADDYAHMLASDDEGNV